MWVNAEVHQDMINAARRQAALPGNGEKIGPLLDAGGDGVKQVTQAESFLTQNFKAVTVLNIQPEGWQEWGLEAKKKQIGTFVIGPAHFRSATHTVSTPQINAGNAIGTQAAAWFNANHGGKGEYGLLVLTAVARLIARTTSMESTMKKLVPNVKLVGKVEAATTEAGAEAAASLLAAHPNLKAILCFNDDGALGVVQAATEAGKTDPKDFWVGGVDGIQLAVDELKKPDSVFQASASFLLTFAAVQAQREMEKWLRGQSIPAGRDWETLLVTKKNALGYEKIIKDPLAPAVQSVYRRYSKPGKFHL
jgi:ABC-type sugar transport system substrate-binding protein